MIQQERLSKSKKKHAYTVFKQSTNKLNNYLITVITPVYNGEKVLKKSIESVMKQTIGFKHIEYILVDDCSTDRTKEIVLDFVNMHENVTLVSLECNSGSPGRPRNIGVELASSPYITFLDADDWLDPRGLEILYEILEETGDPYVVGRTIKVENGRTRIIGEHQCCKERRRVSPFSIPHIFHHLGPTARMIRTEFIKEKRIQFPTIKFGEDKQFFIDVLANCKTISTTTKPIYYVNRLDETKDTRLTNQTNILQKTNYNLKVIRSILNRNYDTDIEKMVVNRIYEYDLLRNLFTTPHFQKTRLKRLYFYMFKQTLKPVNKLAYDISENFFQSVHKILYKLLREGKYRTVIQLLEWDKSVRVKEVTIKNQRPFLVAPFLEEKYKFIPLPIYIVFKHHYCQGNQYILSFRVYGDYMPTITDVLLRDWNNAHNEYNFPVMMKDNGEGRLVLHLNRLNDLPPSSYSIFVRYHDYMRINIRQLVKDELNHHYGNREFQFYHSPFSNVALRMKHSQTLD